MTTRTSSRRLRAAALGVLVGVALPLFGAPALAQTGPTTTTAPATEGESNPELKAQYDEMVGQEADLFEQLSVAQSKRKDAQAQLVDLQARTATAQLELLGAQADLDQADALVERRLAARQRARAHVRDARDRLRRQIVASYVTGGDQGGVLEALLAAADGEQAGQALAYGRAVTDSTDALVTELEQAEAEAATASRAADRARRQAVATRNRIEQAARFLVTARTQQQDLVDQLNVEVLVEADALRQLQGRKAVIEGRINTMNRSSDGVAMILARLQARQPDWEPGSVEITTPLPGVQVSSGYGMRHHPILGIDRLHAGDDLGAPTGTPIHAAADGVVVLAEVRGGYGNAVVIDHGHSLATLYGHTSKLLVTPGQIVQRGDVIALVGSTGLSTGPHLHFETRVRGLPIDPTDVVDFSREVDYGDQGN